MNMFVNRGCHGPNYRSNRTPAYMAHIPFDPCACSSIFPGAEAPQDDEALAKMLVDYHSRLSPSLIEQQSIATLVAKVMENLEGIALDTAKFPVGHIEETRPVGSFKKGTMLAGHCVADLVVVLRELPSIEITRSLGQFLTSEFVAKGTIAGGLPDCLPRPYGFDFSCQGASIRVAFTVHKPCSAGKPEAGVHISEPDQSVARAAIRHARWAEEKAAHANVKALVRILKDYKRRFFGFNHLSPWHIDLLSYYAVMQNPMNAALPLSVAFKRVFQLLSAGLFLPGSAGFIDPCQTISRRIHALLTLVQQDELCCAAQAICRIICLEKYPVLFPIDPPPKSPMTTAQLIDEANVLPGETILAPEPIAIYMPSANHTLNASTDQSVELEENLHVGVSGDDRVDSTADDVEETELTMS